MRKKITTLVFFWIFGVLINSVTGKELEKELQEKYMSACTATETILEPYCNCVFDGLTEQLTEIEYFQIIEETDDNIGSQLSIEIGKSCSNKLPTNYEKY